ncbi:MAG: UDP-N-acetylglucosamine 2-epimerase (non-hydrolyzing), partial [Clostridia bacterium]|nr:UDP-N-acetylglucosamine 2-epimerase (non-hydrolyzing) [Clostridia bacterium]
KPNIVLVHGDTTTSFASALAAFYNHVKIGHVEAGLRTYDLQSPFPEEANRVFVDDIVDLYFAPTALSKDNLLKENVSKDKIVVTGNTAIDALKYTIRDDYTNEVLEWAKGSRLILLTAHRRENLGEPMRRFFRALKRVMEIEKDVKVVYPVHLNPVVQQTANEMLGDDDRIRLIAPLNVFDFHNVMANSYMILTDSGGVQEEAPSLGKPVLVLRDTTERPEGVKAGTLKVCGTDEDNIYQSIIELLHDEKLYNAMSQAKNPYGDGFASKYIADAIVKYFSKSK